MRLLRYIHKAIISHDDRTSEKSDNAWEPQKLSHKVGEVAVEENETRLLERSFVEGIDDFEEVAETEACKSSEGHTEKEEVGELEYHLQDGFEGELAGICESEFGDSSEQDDSNCIIDDALSKKNSIQNGILVRLHEMKKYFD